MLRRQLTELTRNPPEGVSVGPKGDSLFTWEVMIVGPAGTPFEGGFFRAEMAFPDTFPNMPPTLKFLSPMWHPNSAFGGGMVSRVFVACARTRTSREPAALYPTLFPHLPPVYPDGNVCISILHNPGTDPHNLQESADERWRPILGVEAVLVSVVSMLSDPNPDSPANIDAAKQLREDPKAYRRKVRQCVEKSLE